MSAFVCSDMHISAIVKFAVENRVGVMVFGKQERCYAHENPAAWFKTLARANSNAVNERHKDDDDSAHKTLIASPLRSLLEPVKLLKLIDCLEYQCSSWSDYELSTAEAMCESIRAMAIRKLPGYEDAPWDVS